jgi:succinate dehydrogenase / fumarate reductase cytochrome b subunit
MVMNLLVRPALSSLGSKYVMALTGLGLILFVLAHMAGNLLIFTGREALNGYAHGLEEHPGLLWTVRIGLLAIFVLHVVLGIRLTWTNTAARPVRYVSEDTVQANWASRHMLLTGLLILAFVIYHLLHFTFGVTDPKDFKDRIPRDPKDYADVAGMVVGGFSHPAVALGYVVAQLILGLHLWHGASSWFQSLGLNRRGYDRIVHRVGPVIAAIVILGNCSIPLAILSGWRPAETSPSPGQLQMNHEEHGKRESKMKNGERRMSNEEWHCRSTFSVLRSPFSVPHFCSSRVLPVVNKEPVPQRGVYETRIQHSVRSPG